MNRCSLSSTTALSVLMVTLAFSPGLAGAQSRWQDDAPGRTHRINVAGLPAPFSTPSAREFPASIAKPGDATLKLPQGFKIDVFTRDVDGPRVMRVAPNGDIFVAESGQGRIKVLKPSADGASVASATEFATGLTRPFGMQFYPAGASSFQSCAPATIGTATKGAASNASAAIVRRRVDMVGPPS